MLNPYKNKIIASLINWSELSRKLASSRTCIYLNNIPRKYRAKVDRLNYYLELWEKEINDMEK